MALNVFASLAKYSSASEENYLTESLVFIIRLLLDRVPAHGLELANLLCTSGGEMLLTNSTSVTINTQTKTTAGIPDIVVKGPDALIYIEVKHDSHLGVDQLERYHAHLQQEDVAGTQLVLLSRSRYSAVETTLSSEQFSRRFWYEIYNWLTATYFEDDVCDFFVSNFMSFLEEKQMSLNHVTWEYSQGIPALLNLTEMIEAATATALPGNKITRTAGWDWRGLYLLGDFWVGIRYFNPLLVVFENNRGYDPVTYHRELHLEQESFFALNKDEQFERIVSFIQDAIAHLDILTE